MRDWFIGAFYSHHSIENFGKLLCFDKEHNNNTLPQIMRIMTMLQMITCTVCFFCFPLVGVFVYLSNWPVFTSLVYIALTMKLSQDKDANKKHFQLALAHFLFTFTLILNLLIVPIYWSVLHKQALVKYAGNTCQTNQLYFVHIFPSVSLFINWYFTDIRLDCN